MCELNVWWRDIERWKASTFVDTQEVHTYRECLCSVSHPTSSCGSMLRMVSRSTEAPPYSREVGKLPWCIGYKRCVSRKLRFIRPRVRFLLKNNTELHFVPLSCERAGSLRVGGDRLGVSVERITIILVLLLQDATTYSQRYSIRPISSKTSTKTKSCSPCGQPR